MILPVPIAIYGDEVRQLVGAHPLPELAALMANPRSPWLSAPPPGYLNTVPCEGSGPTMQLGLMSTRKSASLSSSVRLSHSFCLAPQIVFAGPSGSGLGERKSRLSVNQTSSPLPQRTRR